LSKYAKDFTSLDFGSLDFILENWMKDEICLDSSLDG